MAEIRPGYRSQELRTCILSSCVIRAFVWLEIDFLPVLYTVAISGGRFFSHRQISFAYGSPKYQGRTICVGYLHILFRWPGGFSIRILSIGRDHNRRTGSTAARVWAWVSLYFLKRYCWALLSHWHGGQHIAASYPVGVYSSMSAIIWVWSCRAGDKSRLATSCPASANLSKIRREVKHIKMIFILGRG